MSCGLYGKLPARRDFIAAGAPRAFLRLFEPWIEAGLREGRARFGAQEFARGYAHAPIWRFWLAPSLAGEAFAGAMIASVDAIGRMYPLAAMGFDAKAPPPPPDADPREAWFLALEELLIEALDPLASPDALVERLEALRVDDAATGISASAKTFAALRADCGAEPGSFWWTIGGAGFSPCALAAPGLPLPGAFAAMFGPAQDADGRREHDAEPAARDVGGASGAESGGGNADDAGDGDGRAGERP